MFGVPKIALYLIAAAIIVSTLTALYYRIDRAAYIRGQDDLQVAVEKRNSEAAKKAQEARNALDRCYDAGGNWDQSRGVCIDKR
jgi:hypothetical protein